MIWPAGCSDAVMGLFVDLIFAGLAVEALVLGGKDANSGEGVRFAEKGNSIEASNFVKYLLNTISTVKSNILIVTYCQISPFQKS